MIRRRGAAARAYARALAPPALALLFQGGFAIAVMALDRGNRALPSNLGYVVAVEAAAALAVLAALAASLAALGRDARKAAAAPLGSETPRARLPGGLDRPWRELVAATKSEAGRQIAEREAEGRAALEDFLESVHALKTPVTALSLMAERAEATGEPMDPRSLRLEIDEMGRQLDRAMAGLRLADFEKGSRVRSFDAAELARASLRRHRRLFIARGLSAEVTGGFRAESDPDWIAFILDQLVSNAAKHAASRVSIEISAEVARDGAGRAAATGRVDVADDGPGFSPEDAARAFGRSASGGERRGAGPAASGYGLYLAREAARRLGAGLGIVEGGGARLRLEIGLSPGPFGDITRM